MASCPACHRPVAVARPACIYCGATLPTAGATPAPPPAVAPPTPGPEEKAPSRLLVIVDLTGWEPGPLARVLDVPPYEARLLARRGGLHLHGLLEDSAARAVAQRLRTQGLAAFLVPEDEARVTPRRALGGERGEGTLSLRTEEGPVEVRRGDVRLVVRGPIVREYQAPAQRRRVDTARLDDGYRVHLHLAGPPPLELDAAAFAFGFAVTGSTRLELDAWVEEVAGEAPRDEAFRRLTPALGPAGPEAKGALSAAGSLRVVSRAQGSGRDDAPLVLDNVTQFRFYSGWRGAVERRRR